MATATATPRRAISAADVGLPEWVRGPFAIGAGLVVLLGLSIFLRTKIIHGQFWMDEALSVGISSHSLTAIPGVLHHDGSPPLYYMLLHVWMSVVGSSEAQTHALSMLFGMLTIPAGAWAAWSLFGRRAALIATILFALNTFITQYSQETRMYTLMALLGVLATAGFIHGFVYRRRKYLILFAVCQALMLYTHSWGIFFGVGAALALIPIWRTSDDRRGLVRDALFSFGAAGVLFLPWLPTLLYQAAHTGAPWDSNPRFGLIVQPSRDLMGGDRTTAALVMGASLGLAGLFTIAQRRSRDATAMWALILITAGTLLMGWFVSQFSPAWASRYFAPTLGAILLLAAFGLSRAGVLGPVALALAVIFTLNSASYLAKYKSDMRDVGGEMAPYLHQGDVVVVGQPEEVPLVWYYLPPGRGVRFADFTGFNSDPQSMNWVDALSRMRRADPRATLERLVATLRPGQSLLFVRPLTEGARNWRSPWTELVRRRSAQWGSLLESDHNLRPVQWAPHTYHGACCVGNSAVLYTKVA